MNGRAVVPLEPTRELAALAAALGHRAPPCNSDPDTWFTDPTAAARVCRTACPALTECAALADAVDARFGVWGGVDREADRTATS